MSWIRGSSGGHIDLSNDIVAAVTGTSLQSVDSVAAGGSGYVVGDLITLAGGTSTIAAVVEVTSVSTGAVTGFRIYNAGVYSAAPTDPVAQASTTGSGTGATFNCTFGTNGWTAQRDTTWSGSEREVILQGSGGGSDEIIVGWRTYSNAGANRYNWELHGFTGFDSGLAHDEQVGISPGLHDSGVTAQQWGTYLPLAPAATTLDYFLSVTPYRIILTVKVASNYFHAYLGFLNRYATTTEYPYPLLICGSTNDSLAIAAQAERMSTLTDPWTRIALTNQSPVMLLSPAGVWKPFTNATINSGSLNSASIVAAVLPCGALGASSSVTAPPQDKFARLASTDHGFGNFISQGVTSAPSSNLEPTPGTGADEYVLFPSLLVAQELDGSAAWIPGEIDDVFWFFAFGGVTSEDRIIKDGEVYRVFQNCNRSGTWEHLAIKEN